MFGWIWTHARGALVALVAAIGFVVPALAIPVSTPAGTGNQNCYGFGGSGTGTYTYTITSGSMPPGTNFVFSGSIQCLSGIATAVGFYNFSVLVYENGTPLSGGTFEYTVNPPNLALSPAAGALANAQIGVPYSRQTTLSGGNAPYTYVHSSGTLPPGLTVTSGGLITGTPTATGTYTFNVQATDSTTLQNGNPGNFATAQQYTITVAAPPNLSINDVSVNEGNSGTTALTFTVSLSSSSTQTVTVNYSTADGTAIGGSDFTHTSGTLTFAPGVTTQTVTVLGTGDTVFESNQTFFLNISGANNAGISDSQGLGTITNDDAAPTLAINDVSASESDGTVTFTVTRTGASEIFSNVNYATADGTALAGSDYTAASGTLFFDPSLAATQTQTFSVNLVNDALNEPTEQFAVNLSSSIFSTITDAQGIATITDDDAVPSLSINDVTLAEGNAGTTAFTFTVSLSAASAQTVTVNYATADGSAAAGSDYAAASGTLTFAPGATTQTITVLVTGDTVFESGQTFFVNLSGAANATIADAQGFGFISNDDASPTLVITDASASEGAGTVTFTVTRTGATEESILVTYGTGDGTAIDGSDYVATSGSLTFTPSLAATATQTFTVALIDDAVYEPTEQFIGALLLSTSSTIADNQAIATITDDDPAPSFSINDVSASEGDSGTTPFTFTVTMTGATDLPIAVNYATQDGTAVSPADYAATSGTLTFPASNSGTQTQTIVVNVVGDTVYEPSEQFAVNLSGPTNGATISDAQGIGTIVGDEPVVAITTSSLPGGAAGAAYSQQLAATGGDGGPYSYQLFSGTLPTGLSLSSSGLVSGTPTNVGSSSFTVQATDITGNFALRPYSIAISPPVVSLAPTTLPGGQVGIVYNQTVTASGGNGPYTYAVTGSFPTGLSLNTANGAIAGTPNATGSFTFTITATDTTTGGGAPYSGAQSFTVGIVPPAPTITSLAPTSGPTAGGTTVLISGANYVNVSSVTFGGAPAAFVITPGGAISATTPARAAGAVDVVVTTPGGTATAAGAYTYVDPGAVRFVINNEDDGSYVFTSPTAALNFTVTTSGGTGSSVAISLFPGTYALSFTTPAGTGLATASCAPSASTVNVSNRTASLVIAPAATTVCTIEAVPSVRATTEMIGAALDASSRLVIANAPTLARRLDRLNGGGGSAGTASAFGKTFASNLPFTANAGENQITFAMSLSGLRQHADADHRFSAANDNGVPASLAASVTPASGLAATAAGDASASLASRKGPRFDIWVEGLIAQFNAAASSDGSFAIVHAGADYLVSDNVLIGVGIQGDWLDMNTATGSLDSSGWLAGPYLTARLAPNLYLDARAAWGGASFDVSPFGTYTDTVDSDRELYSAALIGEFDMGTLTIRPEARVTWYKEVTDAYVDSLSVAIPSVEIKTGEVTFGPSFEWTVTRPSGSTLIPTISFDLIWTFQQDNTATAFTGAPGLDDTGLRGRIETGLAYTSAGGVSVGGSLFYDGIGGGDFEAWGGKANIRFGF